MRAAGVRSFLAGLRLMVEGFNTLDFEIVVCGTFKGLLRYEGVKLHALL